MFCKEHSVFQALLDVHCVKRWHFVGDGNSAAFPPHFVEVWLLCWVTGSSSGE